MLLMDKNLRWDLCLHKVFTFYCLAVDFIADHIVVCDSIRCFWVDKASTDQL